MRAWLLVVLLAVSLDTLADCRTSTAELARMQAAVLTLAGPQERVLRLDARIADEARERAAGFQHICPQTIERRAILFRFARVRRPSFHMHNVKAPLDIAFIDADGRIVDIQRMQPYVAGAARQPTYSPPGAVAAALETRAGWFAEHGVRAGDWRLARVAP